MKKSIYFLFSAFATGVIWSSCQRESAPSGAGLYSAEPMLPATLHDYNDQGSNRSGLDGKLINNKLAQLGRVLFYDKALSVSNNVACASCHHQEKAFSDGLALSRGFMGEETARNSMAIFNMATNGSYFWDLRRDGLKEMVLDPVQHLLEMGMESPSTLSKKIEEIPYYKNLFSGTFGSETVTSEKISDALAEFISAMMSNTSRFDQRNLTAQEFRGQEIFITAQCVNCHGGPNFNNQLLFDGLAFVNSGGGGWGGGSGGPSGPNLTADFANIGLDYSYADPGISPEKQAEFGLTDIEKGLFKIPSLRNIAITGPYMHDGRFKSLIDVINHYDHGVKGHSNLDPRLQEIDVDPLTGEGTFSGIPRKLHLSQQDKEDLIAFFGTLTDQTLTTHPRFSNPFRPK